MQRIGQLGPGLREGLAAEQQTTGECGGEQHRGGGCGGFEPGELGRELFLADLLPPRQRDPERPGDDADADGDELILERRLQRAERDQDAGHEGHGVADQEAAEGGGGLSVMEELLWVMEGAVGGTVPDQVRDTGGGGGGWGRSRIGSGTRGAWSERDAGAAAGDQQEVARRDSARGHDQRIGSAPQARAASVMNAEQMRCLFSCRLTGRTKSMIARQS